MTCLEIYDSAAALIGEIGGESVTADLRSRTIRLINLSLLELKSDCARFRGESVTYAPIAALSANYHYPDEFAPFSTLYTASALAAGEDDSLSKRLYAQYEAQLARLRASLTAQTGAIKDVYS